MRAVSLQLVLAACVVSTGGAQTSKDKVGLFVTSLPYAQLSLDNTSSGQRRGFLVGQDYAYRPILHAVAGDFDGNGCDSLAIYEAKERRFLVGNTNTPSAPLTPATFTVPSVSLAVRAITGDWNNDGHDDFGLYDSPTQTWHLDLPDGISTFQVSPVMKNDLIPVVGDWNGDGQDTIGLFDGDRGSAMPQPTFYLASANSASATWIQVTMQSPPANGFPCAGNWIPNAAADTVGVLDLDTLTFHLGAAVNPTTSPQTIGLHSTVQFNQPDEEFIPGQLFPDELAAALRIGVRPVVGNWDTTGSAAPYEGVNWPTGTPASQGFSDTKLQTALAVNDETHLQSVLVIRNGVLVAECYYNGWNRVLPANVQSTSKSILSCLYGIAIDKGHLPSGNLQDINLKAQFPDQYAGLINSHLTLYHMLTMTAGLKNAAGQLWSDQVHIGPMLATNDWVLDVLGNFMGNTASVGTPNYGTGLTHVASYLLGNRTGVDPRQFAQTNLWAPLGIEPTRWDYEPRANPVAFGGSAMWFVSRDIARIGKLYMDQGATPSQQVVSPGWITKSLTATETMPFAPTTGELPNYGLWWYRTFFERIQTMDKYETFWTWGHGGQHIFMVPSLNLLVVTTSQYQVPLPTATTQSEQNRTRFRQVLEALFD